MIDYELKDKFTEDSVDKYIYIPCGTDTITNSDIVGNKFTLTERLCSTTQIQFGGCEASELKFTFRNRTESGETNIPSMTNKLLNGVYMVIENNTSKPFTLGTYRVYSDTLSKDRKTRDIVAYDLMYDIINADMTEWYNGLTFPISIKSMRDSFFTELGITQQNTTLINDNITVNKSINEGNVITGDTIIRAICEINGVFGHMNRQNVFTYIALLATNDKIYPSLTLYPANNLYPIGG